MQSQFTSVAVNDQFPRLLRAATPLLAWIGDVALPFWGTVGVDHERGGFHERLDLAGKPVLDVPKRLMVQGRQLFVYCSAALLGWYPDGRELADRCADYMLGKFYRTDGRPGWIHSLAHDGSIANPMRDGYAHAFALLGLSWYFRLTGDRQVIPVIDATIAHLDDAFAAKSGGYLDAVPPPDAIRRQNPHMHLFEAFIALSQAVGGEPYLSHATAMFELFASRFFQPSSGALCEYMSGELAPLPDTKGRICEPGHHYEWIWLLRQYQRLSGRDVTSYCTALYRHADAHGWDKGGFIIDELDFSGNVIANSRRSWAHTEGAKANIVEGEAGRAGCDEKAAQCLARLSDTFLARPIPAGWIDRVSADGAPIVDFMPASTLYHVFGAVSEAHRVTSGGAS
jgi:mannose/cellobiose epimerase-like protein (N-acyl-D-glucosamine 2-epimerase family)